MARGKTGGVQAGMAWTGVIHIIMILIWTWRVAWATAPDVIHSDAINPHAINQVAQSPPSSIFSDRFEAQPTKESQPPEPIQQATGQIIKGPYQAGSEVILTPLNPNLLQTASTYRGDVINARGHYRLAALIPQGPVQLTARGRFFNELTGTLSPDPIRLDAITTASEAMNVHVLTHLETERVRTLVQSGLSLAEAKTQAAHEWLALLGYETDDLPSPLDVAKISATGNLSDALRLMSTLVLIQADASPRDMADLQAWITTLREDAQDGQLTDTHQEALIASALAAQTKAQSIDAQWQAALDLNTQTNPSSPETPLAELLVQTLDHLAHKIAITQTAGGTITPTGTQWQAPNTSFIATITPDLGHHLVSITSDCGGVLDETQNTYTIEAVQQDCQLQASFAINRYTITGIVPEGTGISPALPITAEHGQALAFTLTPPAGLDGLEVTGCGGQLEEQVYTTQALEGDCVLSIDVFATFEHIREGQTIRCDRAGLGDMATIDGITYTKRNKSQITPANAPTSCITGVTDLSGLFKNNTTFNGDISHWDTESVTHMDGLFENASAFNQDLGAWCVASIPNEPEEFASGAVSWKTHKARPNWGMDCALLAQQHTVSVNDPSGGVLEPVGEISIYHGRKLRLQATADVGYELNAITGCGGVWSAPFYVTDTITADCSIAAEFVLKEYAVSITGLEGASLTPAPSATVPHGTVLSWTITPPTGLDGIEVSGCGGTLSDQTYTTSAITADCDVTFTFYQRFSRADNGLTILCPQVAFGESGVVSGITYTKRAKTDITSGNAATSCISGVTDLSGLFKNNPEFNGDITHWDTASVTNMDELFANASAFNQDLGGWCVSQMATEPLNFDAGASSWDIANARPNWGMDCPLLNQAHRVSVSAGAGGATDPSGDFAIWHGRRVAIELLSDPGYVVAGASGCGGEVIGDRFVSGVITADCSIAVSFSAFYLADNGVTVVCDAAQIGDSAQLGGETFTKRAKGDITTANAATTCTSGITDFSELFKNATGFNEDIGHWDVSDGTSFLSMFEGASAFNQDLSHWDTTQAVNMDYMFYKASVFDQDLSGWCVENIGTKPFFFEVSSAMSDSDLPPFSQACGQ